MVPGGISGRTFAYQLGLKSRKNSKYDAAFPSPGIIWSTTDSLSDLNKVKKDASDVAVTERLVPAGMSLTDIAA